MTIQWEVRIRSNPYKETIPDRQFAQVVRACVAARADDVAARARSGEFGRDSMAFVVLDPTTARRRPGEQAILFVAEVGPDGAKFLPNASAKAFEHWDLGADCGVLVYVQNHRLADGRFGFGFSVELDGTIVGASGESELQDRFEAVCLAAELNYRIGAARADFDAAGKQEWYAVPSRPDPLVRCVASEQGGLRLRSADEPTGSAASVPTAREEA